MKTVMSSALAMMLLLAAGAASAQSAQYIPSCPANTFPTCGNVCLGVSASLNNGVISGGMSVQNLNAANMYTINQALVTVYDAYNNVIARVTPSNCVGRSPSPQGGKVACPFAVSVPYSPQYTVSAMLQGGPCYSSSAAAGGAQAAAAMSTTATTTVDGGAAPAASGSGN